MLIKIKKFKNVNNIRENLPIRKQMFKIVFLLTRLSSLMKYLQSATPYSICEQKLLYTVWSIYSAFFENSISVSLWEVFIFWWSNNVNHIHIFSELIIFLGIGFNLVIFHEIPYRYIFLQLWTPLTNSLCFSMSTSTRFRVIHIFQNFGFRSNIKLISPFDLVSIKNRNFTKIWGTQCSSSVFNEIILNHTDFEPEYIL